ncbi:MAG TPA: TonB family protein [Thermoanaerobaculia bacterium]|nr:TonB family protein [Thermoanaerobaculia bacterium]
MGYSLAAAAFVLALAALLVVSRPPRARARGGDPEPATVTTETAELRREPSAGSAVAGVLPRGARVMIVTDRGPWIEVKSSKGASGFVSAESIERDADRHARERRAAKILSFRPVFGVVAEDTEIRLAPFPFAPRAGRLARGAAVSIYAADHGYFAFRSPDAGLAFVNSSAVDLVPPDPRRPEIVPETAKELKDLSVTDASPLAVTPSEAAEEGSPAEPPETSDEALEPPVLLSKLDPIYPESARRAGVEGTVVLDAQISAAGRVEDVQVLRGLPLGLSEAAAEAVRHWHYRPARGRFGPVSAHKTVRIVFTLGQ